MHFRNIAIPMAFGIFGIFDSKIQFFEEIEKVIGIVHSKIEHEIYRVL